MANRYLHEQLYRGADAITRLSEVRVTLCGAGAIGSHLADNLVRQGFAHLRVIDDDRIEEHNVSTQLYGISDVGAKKVDVLRNHIFRATGIEIETHAKRLTERTAARFLKGADLVIDTFDNADSRQLVQDDCRRNSNTCLHIGMHTDYCEAIWGESYKVPRDVAGDVCDYPLARNLVLLAVSIATESIIQMILTGAQASRSATLCDFAVRDLETPCRQGTT